MVALADGLYRPGIGACSRTASGYDSAGVESLSL